MLYIAKGSATTAARWHGWHVGDGRPKIDDTTPVMTFQADGDELEMILQAMGKTHTNEGLR